MPHYEYVCKTCNKTFTKTLTMREHDAGMPACRYCSSHDIEQRWFTFSASPRRSPEQAPAS